MKARGPYECVDCGKQVATRRELGKSLRCKPCGLRAQVEQVTQMHYHDGPWFDDWRRRSAAALGLSLPPAGDELPPRG